MITNLPAVIERDAIDQHFDSANAFLDRKHNPGAARTVRRGAKAFSVTSRRGHTLWAVACAEFHGGEKIRMTFSHLIGKPWDFAAQKRLLAQAVGNERARGGADIASADRTKAFKAAQVMAERGATDGERAAGALAVKRLATKKKRDAKKIMETLAAKIENLARYNGHPPATDFRDFWIELDGSRIDAMALPEKPLRARLTRKAPPSVSSPAPESVPAPTPLPNAPTQLLEAVATIRERYGDEMINKLTEGLNLLAKSNGKPGSRIDGWNAGTARGVRIHLYARKEAA